MVVLAGLEHLAVNYCPAAGDVWLVAPADMPLLSARVIDQVIETALAKPTEIVVACRHGQRGHPVAFPWPLAAAARGLAGEQGLNQLLKTNPTLDLELGDELILADVDTPNDYQRWRPRGCEPS